MGFLIFIIIVVLIIVIVRAAKKPNKESSATETISAKDVRDAIKIDAQSTGKYEMTMTIDYDADKLEKLIKKRPADSPVRQTLSPIKLTDDTVKKIFKGIRIIYAIDKTKSISVTENKLSELKLLLEDLKTLEDIKTEYPVKYDGEKWNSFVFRTVNEFQRHKQKFINETNTPSTLILSAPGQSLKDWEEIRNSKLKTKTNR
jgi:hypothetical protein